MATRTATKVVLELDEYEQLTVALNRARLQIGRRREAERALRGRIDETSQLLILALHQLAAVKGSKDHSRFARGWLKENRRFDTEGVPFGGEA